MKRPVFRGCATAIVTPMKEKDKTIDPATLARMIGWQISEGVDAIVICGTTGETSTLSEEEYALAVRCAVQAAAGRVPVIAGAGSNDTRHAVWLSKLAEACGADALLHVTPYYNKCSQKGLIEHFFTIADQCALPIILYNVPSRTGVNIQPKTYAELCRHPGIAGVKEANGDIASVSRSMRLCGDQLVFYSGNDDMAQPMMALGGMGVISVMSNAAPRYVSDLCRACLTGDYPRAARMQVEAMGFIDALFCDVNPIPVKEAMKLVGYDSGPCRLPLTPMDEQSRQRLIAEMAALGIL